MPLVRPHAEPVMSPIPAQLAQIDFNDPVQLAIFQAQSRFEKGQDLLKQGQLKRAKDEFNSSVDVILETSAKYPKEVRLQKQLLELVARINALEIAALREGDGFTDEVDQPAAIDELKNVETFDALIDT